MHGECLIKSICAHVDLSLKFVLLCQGFVPLSGYIIRSNRLCFFLSSHSSATLWRYCTDSYVMFSILPQENYLALYLLLVGSKSVFF